VLPVWVCQILGARFWVLRHQKTDAYLVGLSVCCTESMGRPDLGYDDRTLSLSSIISIRYSLVKNIACILSSVKLFYVRFTSYQGINNESAFIVGFKFIIFESISLDAVIAHRAVLLSIHTRRITSIV
jgi:hypothetical protein